MTFPKPECTKTPERLAVEGALRNAAMAGRGLTITEAAEATCLPVKRVRRIMQNLQQADYVENTTGRGCVGSRYTWARLLTPAQPAAPAMATPGVNDGPTPAQRRWSSGGGPTLYTPVNGPGFTLAPPVGSMPTRATARITAASMRSDDPYLAPELKVNPGILPERMAAYDLPSRVGNWRLYPDGRREAVGVQG